MYIFNKDHRYTKVYIDKPKTYLLYILFKRFIDFSLSLIGIILSIPFLLIVGGIIKLESSGPFLYKQIRVGKNGKLFTIYKLRSMYVHSEENIPTWTEINDSRITRVGRFIRRTRIDEIPQFINILKGEMSFIGPRPERPYFMTSFSKEIPSYRERLKVEPGLTGWAQVNGGYDLPPKEKLEKDLFYINNQCFLIDIKIFLKTIIIVLTGGGAR